MEQRWRTLECVAEEGGGGESENHERMVGEGLDLFIKFYRCCMKITTMVLDQNTQKVYCGAKKEGNFL